MRFPKEISINVTVHVVIHDRAENDNNDKPGVDRLREALKPPLGGTYPTVVGYA